MQKVHSIDYVMDALQVLADNPYSLLWDICEDISFNGHVISIQKSNQFKQVLIDGIYQHIGGIDSITYNGVTYKPMDYIRHLLTTKKGATEMLDFGSGSAKEIREAISKKTLVKEDKYIKVFSPSSDEYQKLVLAAQILSNFTGKSYFVKETYFDYGQDWKWTTILRHDSDGNVQVLSPRDQENILTAFNATDLGKACDRVLNKTY